jgi:DNA-binding transcriptional LysR family regulator
VVERTVMDNFCASLSDGTLAFKMQRLSELQAAAGRRRRSLLGALLEHVPGAWLADVLARLQVRYPEVQVVFAHSRRPAETQESERKGRSYLLSS